MRRRTYLLALAALTILTAAGIAVWAGHRPAPPQQTPGPGLVSPVCAVMVSGTPVQGEPTTLPDGTGSCAP